MVKKNQQQNTAPNAGEIIGSFANQGLEFIFGSSRNAFLNCITSLQSGNDPKPYLITIYAISSIPDPQIRDSLLEDFRNSMEELDDMFSPEGIIRCIAAWSAISEYLGFIGLAGKKDNLAGEVDGNESTE